MEKRTDSVGTNEKGFTLIELIIVLLIIGIATAIVGGSLYRNMDDVRLKTASKEIAAVLRYARSRSVAEKIIFSFNFDERGYRLYTGQQDDSLKSGKERREFKWYKYLPEDIYIEKKEKEAAGIDFFPEGDSTGGEIILKNRQNLSYVISVDKIQSSVKIE